MVCTLGQTEGNMMVNGQKGNKMELVCIQMKKEKRRKENGKMVKE